MPTNSVLVGPYWPEPIRFLAQVTSSFGFVTIEAVGLDSSRHYTTTLPPERWQALRPPREAVPTFSANAAQFRLALEAERLALAYTCDPLLATNNSRVDILPHQLEAVYGAMLPQPTIRHLMAHDAGAGKTIMAGLLHKELRLRQSDLRTLIVAPAALVVQWQRELSEKFAERFDAVDRDALRADAGVWSRSPQVVTSVSFASQPDVLATLASVPWDLVIVDEAHRMAAYAKGSTLAYRLGEVLSRQTRHLVLATATPHKGDAANFLKLLQLLDPGIHDAAIVRHGQDDSRGGPLMLRRLKEEMVDFEGHPLFKPRLVETRWHRVGDSQPELDLYTALTEYVSKTYRAAERLGGRERVNVQFALAMLQRRMCSSFAALERSLHRRRDLLLRPDAEADALQPALPLAELDELPEGERWEIEQQRELATPSQTKKERQREALEVDGLLAMAGKVKAAGEETKVAALRQLVAELGIAPAEGGEKLLVFTEFKDTLDYLLALFQSWGFRVTQIHGGMEHSDRRRAEREFSERAQVMVATEAAGEGINLQFCAHMVNYDLPWVPTRLEQRMGRIHRYLQQRVARIYNLAAADTREGVVLAGLLERLDDMRKHLGDQVFDVISVLVGDTDMEQLLTQVALAPSTQASQVEALNKLVQAMEEGATRYRQFQEHPFAIEPEHFRQMQEASRQSRLTPEYAQHFFVEALEQLGERPQSLEAGAPPGDAALLELTPSRRPLAYELGLAIGEPQRFTFLRQPQARAGVRFAALGTPLLDGALRLARERWGQALDQGAIFLDPALPPGESYLLWFLAALAVDGTGRPVQAMPFAVRQNPSAADGDIFAAAPPASLIDLIPAPGTYAAPQTLLGLARDRQPALNWSTARQQLPFLAEVSERRGVIVSLRRDCLIADAEAALAAAEERYNQLVFASGLEDEQDKALEDAERAVEQAKARLGELRPRFEREAACSLAAPTVLGVAAVLSLHAEPEGDLSDRKPEIAASAQAKARQYEEEHGRAVTDVSGEHVLFPYDLHSKGPGGPRCIEVKGTTGGRILLSENERRAARRLRASYYLYIVSDPLGAARLTIVRDPLSKMKHDSTLYSGVRYAFEESTWRAVADEETDL